MLWQILSSAVLSTLLVICSAHPRAYSHIQPFQQQRQLYFQLPASSPSAAAQYPFAAAPSSNYVYFAPQTQQSQVQQIQPAKLVNPAPSALRYPSPATAVAAGNGQYVFVYPGAGLGAAPGGGLVYVGRQEEGEEEISEENGGQAGSGWTNFFGQIGEYFSWPFSPALPAPGTPGVEAPVEAATGSSGSAPIPIAPSKPEKVELAEKQQEIDNQFENSIASAQGQRFYVVGQPQFFGNFGAFQKASPAKSASAANGGVSSFLLLRNGNKPETNVDEPVVRADGPGSAALAYQRLLVLSQKQQQQQRENADAVSVTVDAKDSNSTAESSSNEESSENVEAQDEQGPSIAQAKPQAISLAGPGGVAAASPVGTALVGPGGMALSAPSATAVAGPTGGVPISLAPANKAAKTYFLAKQNPQYLFPYKP